MSAPSKWLFSPGIDLGVFLGSAVLSLVALAIGSRTSVLHGETPGWAWVPSVVLVDVAHVWATGFRVYLDPEERARRPWLYTMVPAICLSCGLALHRVGEAVFWRALAYVAIVHFVRQQAGWVQLYRARAKDEGALGRFVDLAAIYAATLYPLLYWHTHLPRAFSWFVPGDVVALPLVVERVARPLWVLALAAYAVRSVIAHVTRRGASFGKDVVVVTTAICWWVGMVGYDSDYAFTVTNVFIHGVPYVALVWIYGRRVERARVRIFAYGPWLLLAAIWALAYGEELVWDRAVWHDHPWLFGEGWQLDALRPLIVPVLATVQLTHYVLDGFIWRRRKNPQLAGALALALTPSAARRTDPAP